MANETSTFAFGGTAPNTNFFSTCQRMLKTRDTHIAPVTDHFGNIGLFFGFWKEHFRVKTPA
jgi:hypothetical protein